jgi:hypothetical protein
MKSKAKESGCAQGTIDRKLPVSLRLMKTFAKTSKKPNAVIPAQIAIIIVATALVNEPLKYWYAAHPKIIITTIKLAITISPF